MLVLLQLTEAGILSIKNSWMHHRSRSNEVIKQVNTIRADKELVDADSSYGPKPMEYRSRSSVPKGLYCRPATNRYWSMDQQQALLKP